MMMRSIVAAVLVAAAGLSAAQGTASPAKKELVQKVLQLQKTGFEALGMAMANQMSLRVMQHAGQAVARVAADKREAVANEIRADIKQFHDDTAALLREQAVRVAPSVLAPVLEEKFSEDELKTLIAWLESPVNKKYAQFAGEIQQPMMQRVVNDTKGTIEPKLKALEQSVTKKLQDAGVQMPARPAPAPKAAASAPAKK